MVQMLWNLIYRLRRFLHLLWKQQGSPGYQARGLAIGVFCGCLPFFGIQTVLGMMLASVFRGNHLLAVSGTWISNPITYVPLFLLNYRVGSIALGVSTTMHHLDDVSSREIWSQGWIFVSRLLYGSALVGTILGCLTGLFVYIFLRVRSSRINI